MKKISFISCILCFAILISSFSMLGVTAAAEDDTAAEAAAIEALKTAWAGLTKNKTELYAIPNENYRYSTAELSDEEKAAFGEYYYVNATGGSEDNYQPPVGQTEFADYSRKSNVKYTFRYKQNKTGNFQVKLSYTKTDGTGGEINSWDGKYAPYSDRINTILTYELDTAGTGISKNVRFRLGPNGLTLTTGCIYVSYDEAIAMPEGYESFGAEDWINAVYATDLSDYTVTDEFKAAFDVLQGYTEEGSKILALKNAFCNLKATKTELYAIPNENYRYSTAELSDEEKAAFGEYYYVNATGGSEDNYQPPVGQTEFADYSGKLNVKYTFRYKQNKDGNFQVKLSYTKIDGTGGEINSWDGKYAPYSDKINTILTYTLDTADTDISKNACFRLYPNGLTLTSGCIYVTYDESIALPEGYEFFSAEDWINTVYAIDLSDYTVTDEFKAAFDALQGCTEEGSKVLALKNAFCNLKATKTELLATPDTSDSACKTTADSAELTDEEKAAFGDYYYHITDGGEKWYLPTGDTFKDYSDKENIKYSFSYKLIFSGNGSNFEVKFYDVNGKASGEWPYTDQKTLKTITLGANSIGGADRRETKGISVNPNGNEVYMGCIYVSYDEPIALPKGCEFFSAEDWVNTVYATDLSTCTVTEEFKAAFAALKEDNILACADINGDYSFNATDMAVLRQRLLGIDSDNYNFDLNGDGHSDICDLIRIKRMLCDRKR